MHQNSFLQYKKKAQKCAIFMCYSKVLTNFLSCDKDFNPLLLVTKRDKKRFFFTNFLRYYHQIRKSIRINSGNLESHQGMYIRIHSKWVVSSRSQTH